jgi:hypothetical protein
MDIPELKAFSDHALAFAVHHLREHKQLPIMFQVLSSHGVDILAPDAPQPDVDWNLAKEALALKVKDLIRERQAYAVVNLSDAYVTETDQAHPLASLVRSGRYSTADIERMGIAKRREAIIVSLETPIYLRIIMQQYYRNADGAIILRKRIDTDSTDPKMQPAGRFYNFFEQEETASA